MAPDWDGESVLIEGKGGGGGKGEGTHLPEDDARVGVLDDRGEAVGVEGGGEGGLLLVFGVPDFDGVGEGELGEDEGDFPGVGAGWREAVSLKNIKA